VSDCELASTHADGLGWDIHEDLFGIYDGMLGDHSVPDVLNRVTGVVTETLNADGATVYLVRAETQELEASVPIGGVRRRILVPIRKSSLAGFCAAVGRAFVVPDAYGDLSGIDQDLHFDRSWDEAHGYRTRDVVCAPAFFKGEVVGVLQAVNSRAEPFGDWALPVVRGLGRLVGYALHHARLYEDMATMKQLQKEKAKFMQVMVHELKSPVAASRMMLEVVQSTALSEEKRAEFLGRISARLDALLELVRDTLDLSRLGSGDAFGDVAVIDLAGFVPEVCGQYREQAEAKGLAFDITVTGGPHPVRIDTQGLQLVLSNLVSNGVKYTLDGSVAITVGRQGEYGVVSVADTGIGIPEQDVPNLFREFYRASNARKGKIEGTGVGLACVKGIAERFGGLLCLETTEGKGSTFSVRLPLFREDQPVQTGA